VVDATAVSVPILPGDYELSLPSGGRNRSFLLHVPNQVKEEVPLPVVVNFHGSGSNATQQRRYSGMNVAADRHGFVVVYPNGTGRVSGQRQLLSFNAGGCCGAPMRNDVDDVGFTEAILTVLAERMALDPLRMYATGMSNGGMMAHRLAADSQRIAAVASVAGQLAVTSFRPSHPVSVMEFHSVDDRWARFDGRPDGSRMRPSYPSVQRGIDEWVAHNECPAEPDGGEPIVGATGSANEGQSVTRLTYGPGAEGTEVVFYKFSGVGHVWPGSLMSLPWLTGRPTTLLDANEVMWAFFSAHRLSSS
jgi:polyhydroxybutyrate depolymerase